MRFEITGTATDVFTLEQIQEALRESGAVRVNSRHAYGWSNQPKVVTFAAVSPEAANSIANAASRRLNGDKLPSLIAWSY